MFFCSLWVEFVFFFNCHHSKTSYLWLACSCFNKCNISYSSCMKLHDAVAKRCIPNKLKGYCIFSLNVQHPPSTLTTKLQPNLASLRQLWAMQLSNQNSKLPTANCHLDPFGVPGLSKRTCPTSHVRFSIHQTAGSTGMLEWLEQNLTSKLLNNIISPRCVWSFNASQEHAIQSGKC